MSLFFVFFSLLFLALTKQQKQNLSLSLSPPILPRAPMADLKLISLSSPFCRVVGNCRRRRVCPVVCLFVF